MQSLSSCKNNKFIRAFVLLMLISAVLHMGILFVHFIVTFDVSPFHFFRIIELDIFFPEFVASVVGEYVSAAVVTILFLFGFFFAVSTKKKGL